MKKTRIIALLLVLAMLLMVFASCDGTGSKGDGGDRGDDGSWDDVDFDGQEVHMYEECSFPAASALMQFLNEESEKVVYTYYEKGLKYKYNDNKNARAMMDLIRETSDAPFGFEIGDLTHETFYSADGAKKLALMYLDNNSTLASTFEAEKGVYVDCLNKMLEKFASFE